MWAHLRELQMPKIPGSKIGFCVYCGDWFECRDHLIPIAWTAVYRTYNPHDTVHCCNLCNALASDAKFDSIADKAFYLIDRYEKKFRRILRLPPWDEEEIKALGRTLKTKVRADQNMRGLLRLKLENLERVSGGFDLPRLRRNFSQSKVRTLNEGQNA